MNLRAWRNREGISAAEFGRQIGVAGTTVCHYERRTRTPSRTIAQQIEAATNGEVTAAELLGLKVPESSKSVRETSTPFESAPVKIAVPNDLADMARKYGLDVEALIAEGGVPRLREAFKAAYIERHKDAIDATNAYVNEHGTPSEQMGMI